eukprot:353716-Chlamydomonas_euryale.AAC.1
MRTRPRRAGKSTGPCMPAVQGNTVREGVCVNHWRAMSNQSWHSVTIVVPSIPATSSSQVCSPATPKYVSDVLSQHIISRKYVCRPLEPRRPCETVARSG